MAGIRPVCGRHGTGMTGGPAAAKVGLDGVGRALGSAVRQGPGMAEARRAPAAAASGPGHAPTATAWSFTPAR